MPVLVQPPVRGLSHPLSCLQLYDETGHIGLLVCTASDLLDLTCLLLQPPLDLTCLLLQLGTCGGQL